MMLEIGLTLVHNFHGFKIEMFESETSVLKSSPALNGSLWVTSFDMQKKRALTPKPILNGQKSSKFFVWHSDHLFLNEGHCKALI